MKNLAWKSFANFAKGSESFPWEPSEAFLGDQKLTGCCSRVKVIALEAMPVKSKYNYFDSSATWNLDEFGTDGG